MSVPASLSDKQFLVGRLAVAKAVAPVRDVVAAAGAALRPRRPGSGVVGPVTPEPARRWASSTGFRVAAVALLRVAGATASLPVACPLVAVATTAAS